METLKFIKTSLQGGSRIFPNCDNSKLLQELMGKNGRGSLRTFKQSDLEILTKLGFSYTLKVEAKAKKEPETV